MKNLKLQEKLIKSFFGEVCESKPSDYNDAPEIVSSVSIGSTTSEAIDSPSNFSLYKLQNTAKEISEFTAANINALYNAKNIQFSVNEAIFLDFSFCGSNLVGNFKTFYSSTDEFNNKIEVEGKVFVRWNGNEITV